MLDPNVNLAFLFVFRIFVGMSLLFEFRSENIDDGKINSDWRE